MNFKANLPHSLVAACIILLSLSSLASPAGKAPIADARVGYSPTEVNQKFVRIMAGERIYFDGSLSFDPDGTVVGYYWDFGDGYTGSGVTINYIYATAGTYDATLKVEDDDGQFSVIASTVTVEVRSGINAKIKKLKEGVVFAYTPGETIELIAEVYGGTPCYEPPHYIYEWRSNESGILGRGKELKIEVMSLGLGVHKITLNVTDCIGDTASDSIVIVVAPKLRAEILNLYDQESWYWDEVLYSDGNWDPDHHFSGGGSETLTLSPDYTRVILREACFNDEGYIEINGNKIYENNDGCCSPGCHPLEMDITRYVHPGDNIIYGYAEDCCGGYGYVSAYIRIDKIPPRRCSILREFSDGLREKILGFPPAGGSNSDAKITLPINSTVCDAKLDVGSSIESTELVFIIDTSGSMDDEWNKICNTILPAIENNISAMGLSIDITIYGIGSQRACSNRGLTEHCTGYSCVQLNEAWGPGTEWVANNHPWRASSLMIIFPISDTAPIGYDHGTNEGENDRSIDNAIQAAKAKGITVYGFWGDADDGYPLDNVEDHMNRLSSQTGGSAEHFLSADQVVRTIIDAIIGGKSDVTLDIGNDSITEWKHDDFLGWETISDKNTNPKMTDKLTHLLRDCNCPGCHKSDNYCTIDLEFTTDPGVNLTLRKLYILYCVGAGEVTCPECQINWTGRAKGGLPPYDVKWVSLDDGVIDKFWIKNDGGTYILYTTPPLVPPMSEGVHTIKFEVVDDSESKASDQRY
ncbi:MAG: PKD domain-containing protein, partial [Candidatus Altiarchaeales archaeon]|nr:PKD domain-containing protein [Candidatus Altiarchaeales archaeon]